MQKASLRQTAERPARRAAGANSGERGHDSTVTSLPAPGCTSLSHAPGLCLGEPELGPSHTRAPEHPFHRRDYLVLLLQGQGHPFCHLGPAGLVSLVLLLELPHGGCGWHRIRIAPGHLRGVSTSHGRLAPLGAKKAPLPLPSCSPRRAHPCPFLAKLDTNIHSTQKTTGGGGE